MAFVQIDLRYEKDGEFFRSYMVSLNHIESLAFAIILEEDGSLRYIVLIEKISGENEKICFFSKEDMNDQIKKILPEIDIEQIKMPIIKKRRLCMHEKNNKDNFLNKEVYEEILSEIVREKGV